MADACRLLLYDLKCDRKYAVKRGKLSPFFSLQKTTLAVCLALALAATLMHGRLQSNIIE